MKARVEKHLGGLAVVVPESLATKVGLKEGTTVDLEMNAGRLEVTPSKASTLSELLAAVTPENVHGEWADGPPAGAEML